MGRRGYRIKPGLCAWVGAALAGSGCVCLGSAPAILHLLLPLQTLMNVTFLRPALGVTVSTPMAPTDVSALRGIGWWVAGSAKV